MLLNALVLNCHLKVVLNCCIDIEVPKVENTWAALAVYGGYLGNYLNQVGPRCANGHQHRCPLYGTYLASVCTVPTHGYLYLR